MKTLQASEFSLRNWAVVGRRNRRNLVRPYERTWRARSWRPRVAINAAWLTNSGRASINSCAMYGFPVRRAAADGGSVEPLDQLGGVSPTRCRRETVSIRRCAHSPVVKRDDAVASRTECRHLMELPRASNTALAGNKQHWLPVAAVIVGQVHHVGTVLRKSATSRPLWLPMRAHAARSLIKRLPEQNPFTDWNG